MKGKYDNPVRFGAVAAQRAVLRAAIRPMVRWQPLDRPNDGYTIVIGCHGDLSPMLLANLRCLAQLDLSNLRELIVVVDRPRRQMSEDLEADARLRFGDLPLRFLFYNRTQRTISRLVKWGWLNAWLSWSLGIAEATTRYVMLHDFDALLLGEDFIERRYDAIRQRGDQYLGVRYYAGNGLEKQDRLVTTFELMFDAAFVRSRFRPLDLFNHVCVYQGRSVDFDTFLWAQTRHGTRSILGAGIDQMVHPSQMICEYVMHRTGDRRLRSRYHYVLLIPYFLDLGGHGESLEQVRDSAAQSTDGTVQLLGRPLNVRPLARVHLEWLTEQAFHLETVLIGRVRPQVREYFDNLGRLLDEPPTETSRPASARPAAPGDGAIRLAT